MAEKEALARIKFSGESNQRTPISFAGLYQKKGTPKLIMKLVSTTALPKSLGFSPKELFAYLHQRGFIVERGHPLIHM